MRKYIKKLTLILFFMLSSQLLSAHPFLDDQANMRAMMIAGIKAPVLFTAKKEQTKATITDLIMAAAPCYPLDDIFSLYPTSGACSSTQAPPSGEDSFFNDCLSNPYLYSQFFHAMTQNYFILEGTRTYNPFEYNEDLAHEFIDVSDYTVAVAGLPNLNKKRRQNDIGHIFLPTFFHCFSERIHKSVNIKYVKKLLDKEFPQLDFGHDKKPSTLKKRQLVRSIRQVAPYIRGEIALRDRDTQLAYQHFTACEKAATSDIRKDLIKLKLAEIKLGVFEELNIYATKLADEDGAVRLLQSITHKHVKMNANLRLAQYYLGFFGHKMNESEGLKRVKKAATTPLVSHLGYMTWAEYYLGFTNPKVYNLEKAKDLLTKGFESCEGIKNIEENYYVRWGEISLGLFAENADQQADIDVPTAVAYFNKDSGRTNDNHLYNIYTGVYGEEHKDPVKAQAILDRQVGESSAFFECKRAMAYYKAGDLDAAVPLFEKHFTEVRAAYMLGCIKGNPRSGEYYAPDEATEYFRAILNSGLDFRDTKARFIKAFLTGETITLPDHKLEEGCKYLLQKLRSSASEFTYNELEKAGFILPAELKETHTPLPTLSENDTQIDDDNDNDVSSSYVDEDEDVVTFIETYRALDIESPILSLNNQRLQKLYDDFSSTSKIKWKKLISLVKAFGGTVDLEAQRMTLPHSSKPFTFHRPHEGNPLLSMKHYWAVLKHMIDHEYKEMCREEVSIGGSA